MAGVYRCLAAAQVMTTIPAHSWPLRGICILLTTQQLVVNGRIMSAVYLLRYIKLVKYLRIQIF